MSNADMKAGPALSARAAFDDIPLKPTPVVGSGLFHAVSRCYSKKGSICVIRVIRGLMSVRISDSISSAHFTSNTGHGDRIATV
jgi:hypothetical protein